MHQLHESIARTRSVAMLQSIDGLWHEALRNMRHLRSWHGADRLRIVQQATGTIYRTDPTGFLRSWVAGGDGMRARKQMPVRDHPVGPLPLSPSLVRSRANRPEHAGA